MNKLTKEEIQKVIDASEALNIVDYSILEKDIFVTRAIHAIADMNHPTINLVFCGGTCLAKAHQIVARMSEDVDFKIYPAVPFASRSDQRKKLKDFREDVTKHLKKMGFEITQQNSDSRDNNGYTVYRLDYPSSFEPHAELKSHIQLEFTLALPRLPTEFKSVANVVDRMFPEENLLEKDIACISVLETAAEKWVALTRRIASISRGHDRMDENLVRHLYDLQAITNSLHLKNDFFYLVSDTIERDRAQFKRHHEYCNDPVKETKHAIKLIRTDPVWQQSYDNFVEAMVFDKEKEGFKNCYEKLQEISEKIFLNLHLKSAFTLEKSNNLSEILTPTIMKQLKTYVKMQLRLTQLCNEQKQFLSDPEKSENILNRAKTLHGQVKKLAKNILEIPEVANFLPTLKISEAPKKGKQAAIIHERFQKNEATLDDVNIVLQHAKRNALNLNNKLCYKLNF